MISLAIALCIFSVPDWRLRSSIPAPATVKWIEDELFLVMGRMLTKLDPLLCCNAASSNSLESLFSSFYEDSQKRSANQPGGWCRQYLSRHDGWVSDVPCAQKITVRYNSLDRCFLLIICVSRKILPLLI